MTPRIDAVVFDLDNTLVDSKVDFARMRSLIEDYIIEKHPGIGPLKARTTMELIETFAEHGDDGLEEDLVTIHRIMDETEIESSGKATPLIDVIEVLASLREMGLKLGLLTRSCEDYSRRVLGDSIGIFDSISCRSPGKPAKPDPAPLEEMARDMDVDVQKTLLVGDHVMDGHCARSAGAMFLAVTTGSSSREELSKYSPLSVLDDLTTLPEVLQRMNFTGRE